MRGGFRRGRGPYPPEPPRFRPKAPRKSAWKRFVPLGLGAALVGTAYGSGYFAAPAALPSIVSQAAEAPGPVAATPPASARNTGPVSFGLCHSGGGTNCVVDGDTIWVDGQNIRIADIDTPETHEPSCAAEQALGDRATMRLHQLVNGGVVTLARIDRDEDSYGRKLRIVEVGGTSVGETLVGEGLARWYRGGRMSWCD